MVRSIAGMILTGGAGSRIGGDKALKPFADGVLLDAVIARASGQVAVLALGVTVKTAGAFAPYAERHPLVPDDMAEGTGPLAGVVAGLDWLAARGTGDWLATFPCDAPFLPCDLVAQLMAKAESAPVLARTAGTLQPACAVWPVRCRRPLRERVVRDGLRGLWHAIEMLGGGPCDVEAAPDAFFNVNTPEDLARAEEMVRTMN